jgi:hypothetical protein
MMPEELAFARRRPEARRARLRPDGQLAVAACISLFLFAPPVLVGWRVGAGGGSFAFAFALLAGGTVSVLATLLATRAWILLTSGERLFADATLTGWVRRARAERQVAIVREIFEDPNVSPIPLHVDRLTGFARSIEARDARTHNHSSRVALHAVGAGKHLGLSGEELARLKAAAMLHDIGALRVPIAVDATDEQRAGRALAGAGLVEFTGERELISALPQQRERFDGFGLPDGLAGDAIPLMARVIAVADAFDIAARERGQAAALAELAAGAGSRFDPQVVDAFVADAQASPISAVRGAFVGVIPRASQGLAEVLRGSASVAAAAAVATTAVVASGVGVAPSVGEGHSKPPAKAATSAVVAGASTRAHAAPKPTEKVRHRSDSRHESGGLPKSGEQPHQEATAPARDEDTSQTLAPVSKAVPSVTQPAEDVAGGVGQAVDQTLGTGGQVGTDVTDTLDQTIQELGVKPK